LSSSGKKDPITKKPAKRPKTHSDKASLTTKVTAVKHIKDERLRSVMLIALRHHSALLVTRGAYPRNNAEKDYILSVFASGKRDFGICGYALTNDLQSLVSLLSPA
jgi:hypothetical protein